MISVMQSLVSYRRSVMLSATRVNVKQSNEFDNGFLGGAEYPKNVNMALPRGSSAPSQKKACAYRARKPQYIRRRACEGASPLLPYNAQRASVLLPTGGL